MRARQQEIKRDSTRGRILELSWEDTHPSWSTRETKRKIGRLIGEKNPSIDFHRERGRRALRVAIRMLNIALRRPPTTTVGRASLSKNGRGKSLPPD